MALTGSDARLYFPSSGREQSASVQRAERSEAGCTPPAPPGRMGPKQGAPSAATARCAAPRGRSVAPRAAHGSRRRRLEASSGAYLFPGPGENRRHQRANSWRERLLSRLPASVASGSPRGGWAARPPRAPRRPPGPQPPDWERQGGRGDRQDAAGEAIGRAGCPRLGGTAVAARAGSGSPEG